MSIAPAVHERPALRGRRHRRFASLSGHLLDRRAGCRNGRTTTGGLARRRQTAPFARGLGSLRRQGRDLSCGGAAGSRVVRRKQKSRGASPERRSSSDPVAPLNGRAGAPAGARWLSDRIRLQSWWPGLNPAAVLLLGIRVRGVVDCASQYAPGWDAAGVPAPRATATPESAAPGAATGVEPAVNVLLADRVSESSAIRQRDEL